MVATGSDDLNEVQKLGRRIKEAVNKRYRKLELEMDGVFKVMLLLKKKKYAAVVVDPNTGAEVRNDHKPMVSILQHFSVPVTMCLLMRQAGQGPRHVKSLYNCSKLCCVLFSFRESLSSVSCRSPTFVSPGCRGCCRAKRSRDWTWSGETGPASRRMWASMCSTRYCQVSLQRR